MLLVIIAALATALLVERRRSAELLARAQLEQAQALQREMQARMAVQSKKVQVQAKPAASPAPAR